MDKPIDKLILLWSNKVRSAKDDEILGNCVTAARQTLTLFVGVRIPIPQPEKLQLVTKLEFFSYIRLAASYMHFVRDIAFGSDMRFARWK